MPDSFDSLLKRELAQRDEVKQLRLRRVMRPIDAVHVEVDGRRLVNFSSNNYLGLTHHPRVVAAMQSAAQEFGAGTGAAGLISGFSPAHVSAEKEIARWKKTAAAVLLPSGYQANHAAVQTLAALGASRGGVRFLLDKLAHASLLDAVRASGAKWRLFPHNHLGKLERLLGDAERDELQVVVTESIFSMDGDSADLAGIAKLKEKSNFVLLVDEAHASGVYGSGGCGYADEIGLSGVVDVSVVTLSKAAGSIGGAVCASEAFCQMLLNTGRAYIYSTSAAPAVAAAIEAAIGVMRDEPLRQKRVRELARDVRAQLKGAGYKLPAGDSPIIPIILGSETSALTASEKLREAGLLIAAVRPPTVARGTSRLRVTVSSEHSDAEIAILIAELKRCVKPEDARE